MTKSEMGLIFNAIMTILRDMRREDVNIERYLDTDVAMMISEDLEAVRDKREKLPMSGLYRYF
jgi:hypothetical protein